MNPSFYSTAPENEGLTIFPPKYQFLLFILTYFTPDGYLSISDLDYCGQLPPGWPSQTFSPCIPNSSYLNYLPAMKACYPQALTLPVLQDLDSVILFSLGVILSLIIFKPLGCTILPLHQCQCSSLLKFLINFKAFPDYVSSQ